MTSFAPVSTPSPADRSVEIFTQPIEMIFRFNAGILSAFQSATLTWMQRRQEAARDTIDSLGKLVHCRNIGEVITIQREWFKRSMHRFDDDLSPLASQTPDMLDVAASGGVKAVEAVEIPVCEIKDDARAAEHTRPVRSTEKKVPNHRAKAGSSLHRRRR